ncbi:MAG: proprotein convertase P-domain-containing protein [Sphingorhabdus sp.]
MAERSVRKRAPIAIFTAFFAAFLLCLVPGKAHAQLQITNNTTGAIPESTSCATTLTRTFNITTSFTVADVNIGALITHNDRGNLRLSLQSPAGTTISLMSNVGTTPNNLSVYFDDAAAAAIGTHIVNDDSNTTVYQRTFRPASALSAFNGQNASGTWTLIICDSIAGSTGSFSRADLVITRAAGIPPVINCPVGSTTFDWGANTWTVGSLNNSYSLAGFGTFNIAMSSTTSYVAGSPAITSQLTGGIAGEVSLFQNLNNSTINDVATTVITMPGGLPGMQFRMFDIDFGANSFADKITVTGSYQGSPVIPTLTNGSANYVVGNVAIGDAAATDTTAAGNVVVTFNAPVDTVTIVYGNHTTAPADPGNQWIGMGDLVFCNPYTAISISKISQVIADGISTTNPKAIPGATVQYCITFGNTGAVSMNNVSATDNVPGNLSFVPGTMRSGSSCGAATTLEDDNNGGADESDPFGMNITGTTITGTAATLAGGGSFAMVFNAIVN